MLVKECKRVVPGLFVEINIAREIRNGRTAALLARSPASECTVRTECDRLVEETIRVLDAGTVVVDRYRAITALGKLAIAGTNALAVEILAADEEPGAVR